MIKIFSSQQKAIASAAFEALKEEGEMVYSTCTHAPEENEEVVQYLIDKYDLEILEIENNLPVKTRQGITEWQGKKFSSDIQKARRLYPQDNNTEGFFLCKIRKLSDKKKGEIISEDLDDA